jgi:cellulose synthase/poly-beta-1,6-N-acetylglucosamine synthase-like glycosyltransferase
MIEAVGIVVPANDEETLIGPCLGALAEACAQVPSRVETLLVLVLDGCSDQSRSVAERWLDEPRHVLDVSYRNVGGARAHGASYALRRFADHDPTKVWLATTDADSRVSKHWLTDHIAVADGGAEALAGTIQVDGWGDYSNSQAAAFRSFYDAHGGHDAHAHVHGANLGVRADAYLEAGGFSALTTGEDHALWNALRRQGRRLVSSRQVTVTTSSRLLGRAPHGFAEFLANQRQRAAQP